MIDVKILKRPKQGNLISSSGGFATAGTAAVMSSDCLQKLTRVLVPVDADQNELPWDAPLDKIWAIKAVKGIYSLEFLSARGLNSAESGVTGGINESELTQYLIDNNYAKKSDIPSLAGFATESWVKDQKYLTSHQSLADYLTQTDAEDTYQPLEAGKGLSANDFNDDLLAKLNGIEEGANKYSHPTGGANTTIAAANGKVISAITVNSLGHVTSVDSKTLAVADIPVLPINKITNLQTSLNAKLDKTTFEEFKKEFDDMFLLETIDGVTRIKALHGLYTDEFLSARGLNADGSSAGGSFGLMRSWPSTAPSDSTTDALGANLGWALRSSVNSLTSRVTTLEGKNYLDALNLSSSGNGNAVTSVTLSTDKKTITVTKGSTFLTAQSLTPYLKIDGSNGTATGVSALINKLTEGTADPTDDDYYVSQYAGGGTTTTTYHRRKTSSLWNYIKGKTDALYVTSIGVGTGDNANKLSWVKNGTASYITVPYATQSARLINNTALTYGNSGVQWFNISGTAGCVAKVNDTPTTAWWHILRFNHANSNGYYTDLAVPFNANSLYYKRVANGSLANDHWVKILDDLNYSGVLDSRYVKKSGDTMTGALTLPKLNIVGSASSDAYLTSDNATNVYFNVGGRTSLVINDAEACVRPGNSYNNVFALGKTAARWSNVYSVLGNYSGQLTADSLKISNTTAVAHIAFARGGFNYFTAPASGLFAFVANGKAVSEANSDLIVNDNIVRPGATNDVSLGNTSYRWSNTYSVLGNFSGLITASAGIKIGDVTITYDSANKGLKISGGGLYSESYISARGINASGGSGTGSSFGRLDDWSKYDANGSEALSAKLGYDLYLNKADKATTLAGYGITNAYSKSEVDTLLTNGSVTKIGTATKGSASLPVYINAGTPTACTAASIFSALTTSDNKISVTVAGQNRTLTVPFATKTSYLAATSPIPATGNVLTYYSGQPTIGSVSGNAFKGSSATHTLWSFPDGGTSVSNNTANVQVLRLSWSTAYFHEIFTSPNNEGIWHRAVINSVAKDWQRFLTTGNYTSYVTKIGTSTVGSATRPIYLNAGVPTAGTYTFGNASGNAPISNGTVNTNLNADLLDGTHKSGLFTALSRAGSLNNQVSATVGGTAKSAYLYPHNNWGLRYLAKADNGGRATIILISDITAWKGSTSGASHYGFIGRVVESRNNGYMGEKITDVVCRAGYSDGNATNQCYLSTSNSSYVKPCMVLHNNKYYLGLTLYGSAHNVMLEGYFWNSLDTFIEVAYDSSNALPSGTSIVSGYSLMEFLPYRVLAATQLATSRTLWGQSFNGSANVTGALTGTGSITPSTTAASNLGSAALVWSKVYARELRSDTTMYVSSGSDTASVILRINATEAMRIAQPNGYVGINKTAPECRLDVVGTTRATKFIVGSTSGEEHIKFSRGGFNYFTAPASGMFAFVANGKALSEANSDLIVTDNLVRPGANNDVSLGNTTLRWSNVYSVLGNYSTSVTTPKVTNSGALVFNSGLEVQLKYNDDNEKSAVLNSTSFKPFKAADGKVDLGASDSRWGTIYGCNLRLLSSLAGAGGDVSIELWRGTNASWNVLNTGGTLKIRSNYTTKAGDWFDCLTLAYNTGNVEVKGTLTPITNRASSLGTAAKRWSSVYAASGVFSAAATYNNDAPTSTVKISGGSLEIYYSTPHIDFHFANSTADYTTRLIEEASGRLAVIGTLRASVGMYSNGYVSARGQNTSSDARLKRVLRPFDLDVRRIAGAPSVRFRWKDTDREDVGSIAQYWRAMCPELTPESPDGHLTLQYGKTALLACVSIARMTSRHEDEITRLRRRVAELEKEVEQLKTA